MSCCCGHGHYHHQGCYSPSPYPPPGYYPPEDLYEPPGRGRRRRRGRNPEELEDYLQGLQGEIDLVRQELAAMREPKGGPES